jgi:hypothetical protein
LNIGGSSKPGAKVSPKMAARNAQGGRVPHSKSRIPSMQRFLFLPIMAAM